jgi:hypothetical protein
LIFLILAFISIIIYTILHESIHILFSTGGFFSNYIFVVIGKGVVSVLYNGDEFKRRTLVSLIAPFVLFSIVICILYMFNYSFLRFITYILLLMSCGSFSDIYSFIYILLQLPKEAKIKGAYWKL